MGWSSSCVRHVFRGPDSSAWGLTPLFRPPLVGALFRVASVSLFLGNLWSSRSSFSSQVHFRLNFAITVLFFGLNVYWFCLLLKKALAMISPRSVSKRVFAMESHNMPTLPERKQH